MKTSIVIAAGATRKERIHEVPSLTRVRPHALRDRRLAADFGVHAGYYTDDINKAFIGADMRFPLGPVSIMPNVDYTRVEDANFFFGSLDVNLQYASSATGPSYWIGAGPTVGYVRFNGESDNETGYDVNGGISWSMGGLRPYVTARYIKLDDFNTFGGAIGLRF